MVTGDHIGEPVIVERGREAEPMMLLDEPERGSPAGVSLETGLDQLHAHGGRVIVRGVQLGAHRVLGVVEGVLAEHEDVEEDAE